MDTAVDESRQDIPFLDFSDPEFSTRSDQVLVARERGWCARTPYGLAILRHREAGLLIRDRRMRQGSHFWPDATGNAGSFAEFWKRSLIGMEGERHKQFRRIVEAALSPRHVEALRPRFVAIAEELASDFQPDGQIEFMRQFCSPFAAMAICELIGLESSDWAKIAGNAARLGSAMNIGCRDVHAQSNDACDQLTELSVDLIGKARSDPGHESYVKRLVAEFDRSCIDDEQALLDLVVITIFGGVDTTKSQLGLAMALLAQNPEEWRKLRQSPELVPNCVEEVVRHRPTTTWVTREAVEDFEFGGKKIYSGETIHLLVHSTALDPSITQNCKFDVSARRKAHFGFGGGTHHCPGHLVARTDMACALGVLVKKLESVAMCEHARWLPESGNTGPICLPLRCKLA